MPVHFDTDPITGITQYFDYDPIKDTISITSTQSVSTLLDQIKEKRLNAAPKGKVESFAHYATIPAIVELQLRKKGLRLEDKFATKAICREIEQNYPYLKATEKKFF